MSTSVKAALLATLLLLAAFAAACGGSSEDDSDESSGPATDSDAVLTATATVTANDGGDAEAPGANMATVVLDGETYLFALDEGGTCNPNALGGGAFMAILTRVDTDGNPVARADGQGTQGIDIRGAPEQGASVLVSVDIGWSSGLAPTAPVESFSIDGNRASGSGMFISEDGDGPIEGTFEVVCE